MKSAPFLFVISLSCPCIASTIIAPDLPARRNVPDVMPRETVGEIAGVPLRLREPPPLSKDESESAETESTGTEDEPADIDMDAVKAANPDLFKRKPQGLSKGHKRLRRLLLFYFHGRYPNQTLLEAHRQIERYLFSLNNSEARKLLEIAIQYGWSDLVFELLKVFEKGELVIKVDVRFLKRAIQNRHFEIALQILKSPALRIGFFESVESIKLSDFPSVLETYYDSWIIEQILIQSSLNELIDDNDAAEMGCIITRQRVDGGSDEEPEDAQHLQSPLMPEVTMQDETVVVIEAPAPVMSPQSNETVAPTDDETVKLEKRANSWGSSTIGNIGTIIKAARRKTRSLFDKGYKERIQEKKDPPRRTSLKDEDLDNIE